MSTAGGFDVETVQLVRLHVETDRVWYGHDGFFCEDSGLSVSEFLARSCLLGLSLDKIEMIRILGVPQNAGLIVRLHERRVIRKLRQRIELGSPALLPRRDDRADPVKVLHALYQPEAAVLACGGLHDMTVWDFPSYAMAAALRDEHPRVPERAARALPYHPAWPAISFLPYHNDNLAVRLLAEIIDPRWFRHPLKPHRISRLLDYLGVTAQNALAMFDRAPRGRNFHRAALVAGTWFAEELSAEPDDPRNFLLRTYASARDEADGMLRACRRFVRFVYEVWLGEAACRGRECGFRPKDFFKSEAEWGAYQAHRAALGRP